MPLQVLLPAAGGIGCAGVWRLVAKLSRIWFLSEPVTADRPIGIVAAGLGPSTS